MLNYTKPRVVSQDSSSPFAMNSEKKQRGKTSNRGKKKEAVDAYDVFKQYYPVFSFAEGAKKEIAKWKDKGYFYKAKKEKVKRIDPNDF